MRRSHGSALAVAVSLLFGVQHAVHAQETARAVTGGGVHAKGWTGRIDASEAKAGMKLEDARLVQEGDVIHATTGPATAYWQPTNTAKGSYTVKAKFREPKYMALNDHPHPYGLFIGGNDMGTDNQTYLYCAAYGTGSFIVRGFGPAPFQLNGRRAEPNAAVHKAAAAGDAVDQEIAITVSDDKVDCAINGTVVGSYPKSAVVGEGKLKSTDGVYGVRLGHNTEALVSGLAVTKR